MANDLKDVMIALHPPSLDQCQRVVDAVYPPAGSAGHICGCAYPWLVGQSLTETLSGEEEDPLLYNPKDIWTSPTFPVEAQDWEK